MGARRRPRLLLRQRGPIFNGIVPIGEFDGDIAVERQSEDFSHDRTGSIALARPIQHDDNALDVFHHPFV